MQETEHCLCHEFHHHHHTHQPGKTTTVHKLNSCYTLQTSFYVPRFPFTFLETSLNKLNSSYTLQTSFYVPRFPFTFLETSLNKLDASYTLQTSLEIPHYIRELIRKSRIQASLPLPLETAKNIFVPVVGPENRGGTLYSFDSSHLGPEEINLAQATVAPATEGGIPISLRDDFLGYLAWKVFGASNFIQLFQNLEEMRLEIDTIAKTDFFQTVKRIQKMTSFRIIPKTERNFEKGDTFEFLFSLSPTLRQNTITALSPIPLESRVYAIQMILT